MKRTWINLLVVSSVMLTSVHFDLSQHYTGLAQAAISVAANTATPRPAQHLTTPRPTVTMTPSLTPSPSRTPGPRPTPGTFTDPAPIGTRLTARGNKYLPSLMAVTVLEVLRGKEADKQARRRLGYGYQRLIKGQEYIAVKLAIEILEHYKEDVVGLYPQWHVSLRYKQNGDYLFAVDDPRGEPVARGYTPVSGESWLFFLVRADSRPLLYFEPNLIFAVAAGARGSGVYVSLEKP